MNAKSTILTCLSLAVSLSCSALTVDFETFELPADSFDAGPVPGGIVTETTDPFGEDSGLLISTTGSWDVEAGILLANNYNEVQNPVGSFAYSYWSGIAISNLVDTTTAGYGNEGAAYTGGGANMAGDIVEGESYSVFFDGNIGSNAIEFPAGVSPQGFYVTNTTYAALAMKDGDGFSRQFEQGDWFQLLVVGLDDEGEVLGSIPFFLADYRGTDAEDHYILDEWAWIDVSEFGPETATIQFYFYSSDVGDYGINTPTYIALDNITATATALAGAEPTIDENWSVSAWFGAYNDASLPWIYQEDLGWLYMDPSSTPDNVNFYSNLTGWTYTDSTDFPWVYSFTYSAWLYYIKNTSEPWLFYNGSTGEIIELGSVTLD